MGSITPNFERRERVFARKLTRLIKPPGFTGKAPGGPGRWSTKRSADCNRSCPNPRGGAIRPFHGPALSARNEGLALAPLSPGEIEIFRVRPSRLESTGLRTPFPPLPVTRLSDYARPSMRRHDETVYRAWPNSSWLAAR
jgi:hypothetical protein